MLLLRYLSCHAVVKTSQTSGWTRVKCFFLGGVVVVVVVVRILVPRRSQCFGCEHTTLYPVPRYPVTRFPHHYHHHHHHHHFPQPTPSCWWCVHGAWTVPPWASVATEAFVQFGSISIAGLATVVSTRRGLRPTTLASLAESEQRARRRGGGGRCRW